MEDAQYVMLVVYILAVSALDHIYLRDETRLVGGHSKDVKAMSLALM